MPVDADINWTEGMGPENLEEFSLAVEGGSEYEAHVMRDGERFAGSTPENIVELFGGLLSEVDKVALVEHQARVVLAEACAHAFAQGYYGFYDDDRAFFSPWGFDPTQIEVPVFVWFGDHDLMVPSSHGQWLVSNLPTAIKVHKPQEGHVSLLTNHEDELEGSLLRAFDGRFRRGSWSKRACSWWVIMDVRVRTSMRIGNMYGPDATFLGVPGADPDDVEPVGAARAAIIGAPFDGGTSHRSGCRFGPQAIRITDYLPHDGMRPSLALGVDPLIELGVVDLGDVEMPSGETERRSRAPRGARDATSPSAGVLPIILGGDHTIALPDVTGVAHHVGLGTGLGDPLRRARRHRRQPDRLPLRSRHADASAHRVGRVSRRPIPADRTARVLARTRDAGLDGRAGHAFLRDDRDRAPRAGRGARRGDAIAMTDCDAVFLSVDVDVVDPGSAPGTGTPEPGGLSSRQLLDAVRRIAMEVPLGGIDVVEVSPPYDHAEITAYLGEPRRARSARGHRVAPQEPARRGDARTPPIPC